MESDLVGKQVTWLVASAKELVLAEGEVESVREHAGLKLATMKDTKYVANVDVLKEKK